MKWFSKAGEWVEPAGDAWRIGLSRENVEDLGDVTFVELPAVGRRLVPESPAGTIEAVKAAADFHSPVAGVVEAVNAGLVAEPSLLNRSPEGEAWLVRLVEVDPKALEGLLDEPAWRRWMADR